MGNASDILHLSFDGFLIEVLPITFRFNEPKVLQKAIPVTLDRYAIKTALDFS